ncbi:hypothetical protein SAMN05421504_103863 [Amycolatopsis xylanica]|uniref:Uncharacterized protein n=1 Tax=Amycolatopsis xylanica TaxID=589385 RepID=A0A1H3EM10_9PSEU|nr:hypothetical protein [Amycolatopsis xylanica]SDX79198.1 hypothetical protein SAMN05421504_103863 [Amycolatopsis xylanica]
MGNIIKRTAAAVLLVGALGSVPAVVATATAQASACGHIRYTFDHEEFRAGRTWYIYVSPGGIWGWSNVYLGPSADFIGCDA